MQPAATLPSTNVLSEALLLSLTTPRATQIIQDFVRSPANPSQAVADALAELLFEVLGEDLDEERLVSIYGLLPELCAR